MSNLIERAALTNEEIQDVIDGLFGKHIPPLIANSPSNRMVAKTAAKKAVPVVLEELEPLMEAAQNMLKNWGGGMQAGITGWRSTPPEEHFRALREALAHYADLKAELT